LRLVASKWIGKLGEASEGLSQGEFIPKSSVTLWVLAQDLDVMAAIEAEEGERGSESPMEA
jgi:hypothetical protein